MASRHILVSLFCQIIINLKLQSLASNDSESIRIDDLVMMKNWNLTVGLFVTDQHVVQSFLSRRLNSECCGRGCKLSVGESHTARYPNMPGLHTVAVVHGTYTAESADTTALLHGYNISTDFEFVFMGIPDLRTARSDQSIAMMTQLFTNSPRPIYFPFFTDQVTQVDELSSEDGTVILRKGEDELILNIDGAVGGCDRDPNQKENDFRALRDSLWSTYPHPFTFDWSICDRIFDPTLCKSMKMTTSRSDNGGNLCVSFHKVGPLNQRCGISMEIKKMTGVFRETSLIMEPTPITSFEGEKIEMHRHYHGLVIPCL